MLYVARRAICISFHLTWWGENSSMGKEKFSLSPVHESALCVTFTTLRVVILLHTPWFSLTRVYPRIIGSQPCEYLLVIYCIPSQPLRWITLCKSCVLSGGLYSLPIVKTIFSSTLVYLRALVVLAKVPNCIEYIAARNNNELLDFILIQVSNCNIPTYCITILTGWARGGLMKFYCQYSSYITVQFCLSTTKREIHINISDCMIKGMRYPHTHFVT